MSNPKLKVVSYSLFGSNPLFIIGAKENAKLVKKYYYDWKAWFYVSNKIEKSVINDLKKEGAHVIIKESKTDSMEGLIWRFLAISDLNVDLMIVRDCDSRITNREAMAVNQWLDSHKTFHIMKDHPFHRMLIMGGMWGCRKPLNFDIKELVDEFVIKNYPKKDFVYGWDQNFLAKEIYPKIKNDVFIHDEFFSENKFPINRIGIDFIGSRKTGKNKILKIKNHFQLTKAILKINYKKKSIKTAYSLLLFLTTGFFYLLKKVKFKNSIKRYINQVFNYPRY